VVVDVVGEHVPGRGENRVLDGDDGFLLVRKMMVSRGSWVIWLL
jgi:hypothetical protein